MYANTVKIPYSVSKDEPIASLLKQLLEDDQNKVEVQDQNNENKVEVQELKELKEKEEAGWKELKEKEKEVQEKVPNLNLSLLPNVPETEYEPHNRKAEQKRPEEIIYERNTSYNMLALTLFVVGLFITVLTCSLTNKN